MKYHVVLGSRGPLTKEQRKDWAEKVVLWSKKQDWSAIATPQLEKVLDDLDEVEDGVGDGAVSLKRGRLPGVKETVVDCSHFGLIRLFEPFGQKPGAIKPEDHPVYRLVEKWAKKQRAKKR